MAKKYNLYLYNAEVNPESANIQSTRPSVGDLKNRFKEGSIPLQTDYADLINIADIGRRACGQAPQQNGPGKGLTLADDGTLNLKMGTLASQDFSPLILEKDILSVDLGSGLVNKTNGICVGQGNGIAVNSNNVAVKAANGITVNGSGVAVKANNGINVDTNGVAVKAKDKTINVESTGISVNLGWGIKIGDGLDVKASNGINVDSNGVSVKANNGINVNSNGVSVKASDGINVNSNGVSVKANNGINVNSNGVAVKSNNGINVDSNGVSVKAKNATIKVESTGISVGIGWGVKAGGEGLDVKASNGINVDSSGVSVKAGNGIKVDNNGVSIDSNKILPRGMIVMFSGSSVPTGWALCDGNSGTPNLIDRFILGGNFSGINGKSNNTVSGDKNNKSFSFKSDTATLNINGKTNGSSLSIAQIPNHQHLSGVIMDTDKSNNYGSSKISTNKWGVPTAQNTSVRYVYHSSGIVGSTGTMNSNSPEKHTHDIDLRNTGNHSHNNKITTPYYILAFIMKL
ncbi:tail fiber protein [Photorhabdus luminescens]|nr:tail fiber protein [Photorhabdus luminescens]